MRLGCGGCLLSLLLLVCLIGAVGGTAWGIVRMLGTPDLPVEAVSPAEGPRAQQKLYDLTRRGGSSRSGEPVVVTERELNAFLALHLAEATELPLVDVTLRLLDGGALEIGGRVPLRHLLGEPPLASLAELLPGAWLGRPVWLRLHGRAHVEPGGPAGRRRYLRIGVDEFAVGRQPLPAMLLRHLLSPSTLRVLRWPLPERVEAITIEPGRAVIRTASGR